MPLYAVTGGIGSGKSHVCRLLEQAGHPVFRCDDEARRLMHVDLGLQNELRRLVGPDVYDNRGRLRKDVMSAFLHRGKEQADHVGALVHPRVALSLMEWVAAFGESRKPLFMECALLYESGFDRLCDKTIFISCPDEERIRRVMARDGVDRDKAAGWMALQMPEAEKRRRADYIVVNDGQADIAAQLRAILPKH